jgi:hypothetical protein
MLGLDPAFARHEGHHDTDIIPVGAAHFEPTAASRDHIIWRSITYDVGKGVTAPPVARANTFVVLHEIRLGEVIP